MCACTEIDVRESANDCILASGEGHSSRGEMLHPICAARPVSSSSERSVVCHIQKGHFATYRIWGKSSPDGTMHLHVQKLYCLCIKIYSPPLTTVSPHLLLLKQVFYCKSSSLCRNFGQHPTTPWIVEDLPTCVQRNQEWIRNEPNNLAWTKSL
jgi:hypothetical protein